MEPGPRFLTACPVGCAAALETTDILLPEGPLLRCAACGQLLSQASPQRYRESMAEFDDPTGTAPAAGAERRRFETSRRFLALVESALGRPAGEVRLLDVGCSVGTLVAIAARLGFRAEGVEPAERAARAAQAAGLAVRQGTLEEARFPDASFDAITLFEVIEHLREPVALLGECRRVLRPGGVMLIGTGNAASWTAAVMKERWEYLHIERHGGHVSFFNPASLKLAAARAGFVCERIETRNLRFFEKGQCSAALYRAAKLAAELLQLPARLAGSGHDMLALLRRA